MFLGLSAALMVVFTINVLMGSFFGSPFLSDIAEMAIVMAASAAFAIEIFLREAKEKKKNDKMSAK